VNHSRLLRGDCEGEAHTEDEAETKTESDIFHRNSQSSPEADTDRQPNRVEGRTRLRRLLTHGKRGASAPNVQDEPRPWLARAVLLGARIVTAMVVGSGALLGRFFIGAKSRRYDALMLLLALFVVLGMFDSGRKLAIINVAFVFEALRHPFLGHRQQMLYGNRLA
jgi:hypothetical protein